MIKVLYPGSFDPITKGHMNIIDQASSLFDEVVVAILQNSSKGSGLFTLQERTAIIQELYKNVHNIKVIQGTGATVDMALLYECKAIVRGIRSLSDFDYEIGIQQVNKDISNHKMNTICLFADREYQFISSSIVRELFSLDKDVSNYVPSLVQEKMLIKKRGLLK